MSRYAKIVAPLPADVAGVPGRSTIPVGSAVKCITLEPSGVYIFHACVGSSWFLASTREDLPAFTDKGRAQREARRERVAKRGRPNNNRGRCMITLPVRPDQKAALQKIAAEQGTDLAGLVRRAMLAKGMPL